ncbi:MAG: pyruvate kinase [Gammaproteobacteria bacterium RIFCSPHIGHO2_12_FULL_35_23]|nr:MAG: pyruvate kinase [Gammaproteobacteria bacterium RIFCSPHIGHO2_12_FULL_35_23]
MERRRRTKIIITLGPALDEENMLEKAILAGADVFRANFSHGVATDHAGRIQAVRKAAKKLGREVAIFGDLQGPKIRVACFKNKKIHLVDGCEFTIDVALDKQAGDERQVGCDYPELVQDVTAGDILLLDDGRLVFKVKRVENTKIICEVVTGGELSNNKGINRQGGGLSAAALTDKDKADLKEAVNLGVDYIAVSFPRSAEDIEEARRLLEKSGSAAGIIAKIERTEAVANIDEIIKASDAVMVARGDLAVEIGDAEVPAVQKHIIHRVRALDKIVITATQMMESMIANSVPTRAEVSDVANAVLDGTDAVMLSAETAVGKYPIQTIEAMHRVCLTAEKQPSAQQSKHRVECYFHRPDEAIAMATMYVANHLDITAIISLTESGSTPLWMSRIRSGIPIFALTRHVETQRKMNLYRGVYAIKFDMTKIPRPSLNRVAADELVKKGILKMGDLVIITKGDIVGVHGFTNSLKIFNV